MESILCEIPFECEYYLNVNRNIIGVNLMPFSKYEDIVRENYKFLNKVIPTDVYLSINIKGDVSDVVSYINNLKFYEPNIKILNGYVNVTFSIFTVEPYGLIDTNKVSTLIKEIFKGKLTSRLYDKYFPYILLLSVNDNKIKNTHKISIIREVDYSCIRLIVAIEGVDSIIYKYSFSSNNISFEYPSVKPKIIHRNTIIDSDIDIKANLLRYNQEIEKLKNKKPIKPQKNVV